MANQAASLSVNSQTDGDTRVTQAWQRIRQGRPARRPSCLGEPEARARVGAAFGLSPSSARYAAAAHAPLAPGAMQLCENRKEKAKDYAFRRQCNEKPGIMPGWPVVTL